MTDLQLNSSGSPPQYRLGIKDVAERLAVATSTLNNWLKDDENRDPKDQLFKFHRWVGNRRKWSEDGFRLLELAVHSESENGVLSAARSRAKPTRSPEDPDAAASLAEVLGAKMPRVM
jgi:hypothetical protein